MTGTVAYFDRGRNFGFLRLSDPESAWSRDIYFSARGVSAADVDALSPGVTVDFLLSEGYDWRSALPWANQVKPLL
jgi:cold shock CspA family protein